MFKGDTVSVQEDENVLEMDGGDGCTTIHVLKATVHLKWLTFCYVHFTNFIKK